MSRILISCIILLLCSNYIKSFENKKLKFVKDFLSKQVAPHKILICFCNKKDSIFQFSKSLNDDGYKHSVIKHANDLENFKEIQRLVILLDVKCPKSMEIVLKAHTFKLFTETNYWLIFANSLSKNLYFPIKSNVLLINETYDIQTIYKFSHSDQDFMGNSLGKWTQKEGFKNYQINNLSSNRSNLMKRPLKTTYYYSFKETLSLVSNIADFRQKELDNVLKLYYIILSHLADYLNATFETAFTANFGYDFDENTNLYEENSMMGDVQRKKHDIIGVGGFINKDKIKTMRFFGPMTSDTIKFIFRAPPISWVENVYILTFGQSTWNGISVMIPIVIPVLYFILNQEQKLHYLSNIENNHEVTCVEAIMISLAAFTQKSWDKEPTSIAGKIAVYTIYLFALILYIAHSANIYLFLQGTSDSIMTFKDLYNAKFDLAVHNVNYNRYYFLEPNYRSEEYWRKKIYKEHYLRKGDENFFLDFERAFDLVGSNLFAFQAQLGTANAFMNKKFTSAQKCSIRYVNTIYPVAHLYIGARKHSPYLSFYKVGIARIYEHGLQRRTFIRLFTIKLPCEGNTNHFNSLGFRETRFVYFLFTSLLFTSIIILLLETILWKFMNSLRYYELLRKFNYIYEYTE